MVRRFIGSVIPAFLCKDSLHGKHGLPGICSKWRAGKFTKNSTQAVGFYERSTLDSRLVWWIDGPAIRRDLRRRHESMHLNTGIRFAVVLGSVPYSYIPGTLSLRD